MPDLHQLREQIAGLEPETTACTHVDHCQGSNFSYWKCPACGRSYVSVAVSRCACKTVSDALAIIDAAIAEEGKARFIPLEQWADHMRKVDRVSKSMKGSE
jgi:hypothetical protein